jgi:hypothetical protein
VVNFGVFPLLADAVCMGCAPGEHIAWRISPDWIEGAASVQVALSRSRGSGRVPAQPATARRRAAALGLADVPPAYLVLYMDAAPACPGLPWGVLAGIGKVESDHGRSDAPGVHSGANFAGAERHNKTAVFGVTRAARCGRRLALRARAWRVLQNPQCGQHDLIQYSRISCM